MTSSGFRSTLCIGLRGDQHAEDSSVSGAPAPGSISFGSCKEMLFEAARIIDERERDASVIGSLIETFLWKRGLLTETIWLSL